MSDLFTFYTLLTGVAAALELRTQRATNTPDHIEIDKGMVAKIWELQMEGPIPALGAAKITIEYTINDGDDWHKIKGFSRDADSNRPERWQFSKPIIIEAWNDVTQFRVYEEAGSTADTEINVIVEFDEMEKSY